MTSTSKQGEFHHTMKNLHPRLNFEKPASSPEGLSLSLLEFKVTISQNSNSSFVFYKKPAKKPLSVHHWSALPINSKINFIHNEQRRIQQSSTHATSDNHDHTFDNILQLNRCPENFIDKAKQPRIKTHKLQM